MVPLTKSQNKWGFVSGRVATLEGRLLPYDFFVSLVALERPEELLHRLQDTPLRESVVPGAAEWEDWTTIVDNYYYREAISLRGDSPNPSLVNIFLLNHDYLNLKRAILGGGDYSFCQSAFSQERLNEVSQANPSLLPDEVRAALGPVLSGASERGGMVNDIILDGIYLRHGLSLGESLNTPLITEALQQMALRRAVVVLWRAARAGQSLKQYQQYFLPLDPFTGVLNDIIATPDPRAWGNIIPGVFSDLWQEAQQEADDEQVSRFEKLTTDSLTRMVQRAKLQTAGPERLFGFLWGLSVEVYNLKLVISGRLNRIDADVLKGRLRVCYV